MKKFEESPTVAELDFLERIILDTRVEYGKRLSKDDGEVDDPAVEYADLLLKNYHSALLRKLIEVGIKL